jgi:serine/threonine protein kinase
LQACTNAVFKVGSYIVKIFAPKESSLNTDSDYKTELFGMKRAMQHDIPAPKLIASGIVVDKYFFRYLIMEYIDGDTLGDIVCSLSDSEKFIIGQKLRNIMDKMNTPCEQFNDIDVIKRGLSNDCWNMMPDSFNRERIEYIKQYRMSKTVYVHGDLNPDNILVGKHGEIYIIDYADALTAPAEYELPSLICESFGFEFPFMRGYLGDFDICKLTEKCFQALLIHDFGGDIISRNLGNIDEIIDLATMKTRLFTAIKTGKQIGE